MGWYKNQLCFQICMICPVLPLQYHFVATFIPIFNSTRVYQLSFNLLKSISSFPLQCFTLCCPSSRSTLPLCLVPNLVLLIIKVQTIMILPLRVLYWTLVTPIHICYCSVTQLCPTLCEHCRLPCPSPSPGAWSNSFPLDKWIHPTISSSVCLVTLSSCLQSFPASGSFSRESALCYQLAKV